MFAGSCGEVKAGAVVQKKNGQEWIRTTEGVSQRIYSPPRLATSVLTQRLGLCERIGKLARNGGKGQGFFLKFFEGGCKGCFPPMKDLCKRKSSGDFFPLPSRHRAGREELFRGRYSLLSKPEKPV